MDNAEASRPELRLIRYARDAEIAAAEWLRFWGSTRRAHTVRARMAEWMSSLPRSSLRSRPACHQRGGLTCNAFSVSLPRRASRACSFLMADLLARRWVGRTKWGSPCSRSTFKANPSRSTHPRIESPGWTRLAAFQLSRPWSPRSNRLRPTPCPAQTTTPLFVTKALVGARYGLRHPSIGSQ